MKRLSYWAKQNPRSARLFITIGRIFLAFSGLFYGLLLASFGHFPIIPLAWTAAGLYLMAYVFYPRRPSTYRIRKTCDALLVYSSFFAYICYGNWAAQPAPMPLSPATTQTVSASLESRLAWPEGQSRRELLKKAKKELRHTVREIRAARNVLDPGMAAALTILSVLLVIGLGTLLVGVSCRLSCNGQESAATAVLLGGAIGIGLIIFLMWHAALSSAKVKAENPADK